MTGWRMWNVFVCDGSGSFGLDFPIEPAVFLQFPHFFNHLRPLQKAITNAIPLCEGQNHSAHRQEMPRFCWCSGVMDRWLCCCVWGPNGDPTGTGTEDVFWARDPPQVRHWKNRNTKSKSHNLWNHPETDEIIWNHPQFQTQTRIRDDSGWFIVETHVFWKPIIHEDHLPKKLGVKTSWKSTIFNDGCPMVKGTSRNWSVCRNNLKRHFKG